MSALMRSPTWRSVPISWPTSFVLPAEDIDRLRDISGLLLHQSVEYESVVHNMGGNIAQ